jgi:hypothetical protein
MDLTKSIGGIGWIMTVLIFSIAVAQGQSPKSIAEVARENREARLRRTVEAAVAEMCSKADDPKVQETYPKIQEKCTDKPALIQAAFESALKKLKEATQENVKRTEDGLANQTAPADAVGRALAAVPPSTQGAASSSESARNDLKSLQAMFDSLSSKTSRQLADEFARDTQFPDRDAWEQRLDTARNRLVAKTQVVIDLVRSKAPSGALNNALYDMRLAQVQYSDVQAEGISKAADWEKRAGR